ncbi:hypothetical protein D3C80_1971600 [compost metagenome]
MEGWYELITSDLLTDFSEALTLAVNWTKQGKNSVKFWRVTVDGKKELNPKELRDARDNVEYGAVFDTVIGSEVEGLLDEKPQVLVDKEDS